MARSVSVVWPIGLTGFIALLALAACTYEDRGYGDGYYYSDGGYYGGSGYRDYRYGYRPNGYGYERPYGYRYHRQYGGDDYCYYHRCEYDDD